MSPSARHRREQAGLSLIEMMVSLALGLFLVAATAGLLLGQIQEQRRQLLDSRLQQELRAVLDLVVRDLRRAGYWGHAVDRAMPTGTPPINPYQALAPAPAPAGLQSSIQLGYAYSRDGGAEDDLQGGNERFGLRLNTTSRTLDWRTLGAALAPSEADTWQALTDPRLIRITGLQVRSGQTEASLLDQCELNTCPSPSGPDCPPRLVQPWVEIEISAEAAAEPTLQRSLSHQVSLRNAWIVGRCPAA
ncbi:MAG: hypothetical protein RL722_2298 [Pseudomonadota bacterium]|jgi:type IV pilus assembly protein PilW